MTIEKAKKIKELMDIYSYNERRCEEYKMLKKRKNDGARLVMWCGEEQFNIDVSHVVDEFLDACAKRCEEAMASVKIDLCAIDGEDE